MARDSEGNGIDITGSYGWGLGAGIGVIGASFQTDGRTIDVQVTPFIASVTVSVDLEEGTLDAATDLPLKFHPAAFRVSGNNMPSGAFIFSLAKETENSGLK